MQRLSESDRLSINSEEEFRKKEVANCTFVTGILGIIGMPLFSIILNANAFSLVGSFINDAK